jgi:micrococcal nuclease
MKLFQRIKILVTASLLSIQFAFASPPAIAQTQVIELPPGEDATVTRVIDGDTIEVRIANKRFSVRYIGVDSAELNRKPLQCFAKEAQAFNRELVLNKTVRLEKDINETDKFGRLLRYVYLQDGRMVNAELVKNGYALAITYPPDVKYAEPLAALQTQAREAGAGLWTKCAQPAPVPTATPAPVQEAAQPLAPAQPAPAAVSGSAQPIDPWTCPDSHPIKGNYGKKAKIYHVPGSTYYSRTKPEKCFATEGDAVNDGFRAPLR